MAKEFQAKGMIAKITPATIKAEPAHVKIPDKATGTPQAHLCAVLFGKADNTKLVEDKATGQVYTALTGSFEATNTDTGEVFTSGVMYFPGGAHEMVVAAVEDMYRKNPDSTSVVEFAVELWAVPSSNKAGYSWEVKSITDIEMDDPLKELKQRTADRMRQLGMKAHDAVHLPNPETETPGGKRALIDA